MLGSNGPKTGGRGNVKWVMEIQCLLPLCEAGCQQKLGTVVNESSGQVLREQLSCTKRKLIFKSLYLLYPDMKSIYFSGLLGTMYMLHYCPVNILFYIWGVDSSLCLCWASINSFRIRKMVHLLGQLLKDFALTFCKLLGNWGEKGNKTWSLSHLIPYFILDNKALNRIQVW